MDIVRSRGGARARQMFRMRSASDTLSTANGIGHAKCQCGQHHYGLRECIAAPSHNLRNARHRKVSMRWTAWGWFRLLKG